MSIVDLANMNYDEAVKALKKLGFGPKESELYAAQFRGDIEDMEESKSDLKSTLKESFLYALKHPGHADQSVHNPKKRGATKPPTAKTPTKGPSLPEKIKAGWNKLTPEQKSGIIRGGIGIALGAAGVLAGNGPQIGGAIRGANAAAGRAIYRGALDASYNKWRRTNRKGTLSDYLNTQQGRDTALGLGGRFLTND